MLRDENEKLRQGRTAAEIELRSAQELFKESSRDQGLVSGIQELQNQLHQHVREKERLEQELNRRKQVEDKLNQAQAASNRLNRIIEKQKDLIVRKETELDEVRSTLSNQCNELRHQLKRQQLITTTLEREKLDQNRELGTLTAQLREAEGKRETIEEELKAKRESKVRYQAEPGKTKHPTHYSSCKQARTIQKLEWEKEKKSKQIEQLQDQLAQAQFQIRQEDTQQHRQQVAVHTSSSPTTLPLQISPSQNFANDGAMPINIGGTLHLEDAGPGIQGSEVPPANSGGEDTDVEYQKCTGIDEDELNTRVGEEDQENSAGEAQKAMNQDSLGRLEASKGREQSEAERGEQEQDGNNLETTQDDSAIQQVDLLNLTTHGRVLEDQPVDKNATPGGGDKVMADAPGQYACSNKEVASKDTEAQYAVNQLTANSVGSAAEYQQPGSLGPSVHGTREGLQYPVDGNNPQPPGQDDQHMSDAHVQSADSSSEVDTAGPASQAEQHPARQTELSPDELAVKYLQPDPLRPGIHNPPESQSPEEVDPVNGNHPQPPGDNEQGMGEAPIQPADSNPEMTAENAQAGPEQQPLDNLPAQFTEFSPDDGEPTEPRAAGSDAAGNSANTLQFDGDHTMVEASEQPLSTNNEVGTDNVESREEQGLAAIDRQPTGSTLEVAAENTQQEQHLAVQLWADPADSGAERQLEGGLDYSVNTSQGPSPHGDLVMGDVPGHPTVSNHGPQTNNGPRHAELPDIQNWSGSNTKTATQTVATSCKRRREGSVEATALSPEKTITQAAPASGKKRRKTGKIWRVEQYQAIADQLISRLKTAAPRDEYHPLDLEGLPGATNMLYLFHEAAEHFRWEEVTYAFESEECLPDVFFNRLADFSAVTQPDCYRLRKLTAVQSGHRKRKRDPKLQSMLQHLEQSIDDKSREINAAEIIDFIKDRRKRTAPGDKKSFTINTDFRNLGPSS